MGEFSSQPQTKTIQAHYNKKPYSTTDTMLCKSSSLLGVLQPCSDALQVLLRSGKRAPQSDCRSSMICSLSGSIVDNCSFCASYLVPRCISRGDSPLGSLCKLVAATLVCLVPGEKCGMLLRGCHLRCGCTATTARARKLVALHVPITRATFWCCGWLFDLLTGLLDGLYCAARSRTETQRPSIIFGNAVEGMLGDSVPVNAQLESLPRHGGMELEAW